MGKHRQIIKLSHEWPLIQFQALFFGSPWSFWGWPLPPFFSWHSVLSELLPESSTKLHFQPPLAHTSRISQFPPVSLFQRLRGPHGWCRHDSSHFSGVVFCVRFCDTVTMKAKKNILRRRGYLCPWSHGAQTRLHMMTFIDITLSLACDRHTWMKDLKGTMFWDIWQIPALPSF